MQKEIHNYAAQSRLIRIKWVFYNTRKENFSSPTVLLKILANLPSKNLPGKICRQHVEPAYCVTLPSYY
jgi:hypothetical protein